MFAIALLLLMSLFIKSESHCNSNFNCDRKSNINQTNQQNEFPLFASEEGFLIKI